jgi:hypothetical protein
MDMKDAAACILLMQRSGSRYSFASAGNTAM